MLVEELEIDLVVGRPVVDVLDERLNQHDVVETGAGAHESVAQGLEHAAGLDPNVTGDDGTGLGVVRHHAVGEHQTAGPRRRKRGHPACAALGTDVAGVDLRAEVHSLHV